MVIGYVGKIRFAFNYRNLNICIDVKIKKSDMKNICSDIIGEPYFSEFDIEIYGNAQMYTTGVLALFLLIFF